MIGYKTFDESDFRALKNIIGDGERVLFGSMINEEYSHDELSAVSRMPDAVVKALSTHEVSEVMKYAHRNHIPVTPRGAGTGLVGAAVPVCGGIVLDISGMNKITELDEENMTVTVQPGVLLMELGEFAVNNGFLYPPDPGEKTATIGGNISTNAGGMRAVKYGVTRDYVRALEVVLADGRVINVGGKVVKNSSGYSLKDLFVGSEGTLGIITEATLKLIPLPERSVSLLVPFATLKQAIDTVPVIVRSKSIPTAVEFMQREVIEAAEEYLGCAFPDKSADAYLLLKFDGSTKEEIENNYRDVAEICLSSGASDVLIMDTEERADTVWKARGAFLEAIKNSTDEMDEIDVVVPRKCINDMVNYISRVERDVGIRIRYFGHAGDGNLHVYVLRDSLGDTAWKQKSEDVMWLLYAKANQLSGKVSGEHGIGCAKKSYLASSVSDDVLGIMRDIKNALDPDCILNPGKIMDTNSPSVSRR